jgi:putative PIN family toxin of toxin-antitoxin system
MTAPRRRAVIDTNVLLDFWVFDDPIARRLRSALDDGAVIALSSGECVDEFTAVLMREQFDVATEKRFDILRRWARLAERIEHVHAAPLTCTDPHDQKFLDLACTARADWLVTKDKALLKLGKRASRNGLLIITPGAAANRLEAE